MTALGGFKVHRARGVLLSVFGSEFPTLFCS